MGPSLCRRADPQELDGVVITTEGVVQLPGEGAVAQQRLEFRQELLHRMGTRQRVFARIVDDKIRCVDVLKGFEVAGLDEFHFAPGQRFVRMQDRPLRLG
jgi:hypothetical protein